MREPDNDMAELERMLGHTKANYRALRHHGPLPEPRARQRRFAFSPRFLVGAAAVAAMVVLTVGTLDRLGGVGAGPSRLSMPSLAASPLVPRPTGTKASGLTLTFKGLPAGSKIPRRPSASRG